MIQFLDLKKQYEDIMLVIICIMTQKFPDHTLVMVAFNYSYLQ